MNLKTRGKGQVVEVKGIEVLLTFSDESNKEVSALVRDILKKAYAQQKAV